MKIQISPGIFINIEVDKSEQEIVFSIQNRGENMKIYLSSVLLNKSKIDELISALVTLRTKLK